MTFKASYAAMAGIAFIYPWINNLWSVNSTRRWNPMKWLWNSATLSISCQLTTAPLAWYYFDSIPSYFIITNLIALPLTSLLIPLALALTILHGIGIHPETLTKATEVIVDTLTAALDIISSI